MARQALVLKVLVQSIRNQFTTTASQAIADGAGSLFLPVFRTFCAAAYTYAQTLSSGLAFAIS